MSATSGKAPPRGKKFYTVAEANRALPLVRAIVGDIVTLAEGIEEAKSRLKVGKRSGRPDEDRRDDVRDEVAAQVSKMETCLVELRDLGIELKGWDGLIDFPCWLGDREVELCWKLGEAAVEYWHEVYAGFAGRQPITSDVIAKQQPTATTQRKRKPGSGFHEVGSRRGS